MLAKTTGIFFRDWAVKMLMKLGDWFRVVQLIKWGGRVERVVEVKIVFFANLFNINKKEGKPMFFSLSDLYYYFGSQRVKYFPLQFLLWSVFFRHNLVEYFYVELFNRISLYYILNNNVLI